MEVKAKLRYLRMSPRKVRLVVDVIRGMEVDKALAQLRAINKRAARPLTKLLQSAVANAENNFELAEDNLYIKEIRVDEGPTLHRWQPRARGRATPIRKRSSHISVVLAEINPTEPKEKKKPETEAPLRLDKAPKEDEGVKIKEKEEDKKDNEVKEKKIIDPRRLGKGKHTKIEGAGAKGAVGKIFRRKSG
jgi:large subunit ribosomal protein L22